MSTYKATIQGPDHKRVPDDIATNPTIVGHEFCGTILEVGSKAKTDLKPGDKYTVQPALVIPGREQEAPGYSFHYIGGDATKIIIPREVMERECLLPYAGEGYFKCSLAEPVSCIIGAFKSQYHWTQGEYVHRYGIKDCGTMALLAGAGPMGLGAIDYTLHGPRQPRLLVVTDIDQDRLDRAASLFPPEEAAERDVELKFVNTSGDDPVETLKALNAGEGYDDVFVFAPVAPVVEQGDAILGYNGCLNFFAGPSDPGFSAKINFYDIHYSGHHIAGSSGGNTEDLKEAIDLMANDKINPAVMITHVGGMDHAAETVYNLPKIPGGKKLIYTQISMPLVALTELRDKAREIPYLEGLAGIVEKNNGLWSIEAEEYLLEHAEPLAAG